MLNSWAPRQERPQIGLAQADSAVERARFQQTHRTEGKGLLKRGRHRQGTVDCEQPRAHRGMLPGTPWNAGSAQPRKASHTSLRGIPQYASQTHYTFSYGARCSHSESSHSDKLWTMPSIPESHNRNIFKCKTCQTWNKNIAFKRRMSYMPGQPIARDAQCPLCRGDDSQGHIFGSCMHPDMSKQYIGRHDKAIRTVIQALILLAGR